MVFTYTGRNNREVLPALVGRLLSDGDLVAPRDLKTRELCDVTITLLDPTDTLLHQYARPRYRAAIGVAEGLLLLAGESDPALLGRVAKQFLTFQDGGVLHGAYGPRLANQLALVARRLSEDPLTRQAIATIWDPALDLHTGDFTPRDLPCTVYLNFRVRHGALTLKTHMRSNDVWRGWCYDATMFTLLQCTMANALELPVGPYVHHVDSLHVYESDRALVEQSLTNAAAGEPTQRLFGLSVYDLPGAPEERWGDARRRAHALLYDGEFEPLTDTEAWLLKTITPYLVSK